MIINILPSEVYNRIAAGEVVENPASVVKELVENALDAGAGSVTVKIAGGGIKSIEVIDDGSGIPKEELHKTILPHATGKIATAEDLDSISTLGFRGEALASIAAISDFEIRTKYYGSGEGAFLKSGASGVKIGDAAVSSGTSVKVENLFYNTPARYKFLRTEKGEAAAVQTVTARLVLSNPNVRFLYSADGKEIIKSDGGGLASAIYAVYGNEFFEKLIKIEDFSLNGVKISGYAGAAGFVKNNRAFQTIVLNGRVIDDRGVSEAVRNAYGERLMRRDFPIFILNILIPFDEVDINVHPAKREARFANPRKVYGAAYQAVKMNLEASEQMGKRIGEGCSIIKEEIIVAPEKPEPERKNLDFHNIINILNLNDKGPEKVRDPGDEILKITDFYKEPENKNEVPAPPVFSPEGEYKLIGQLFDTYILIEYADNFFMIDRHAAHERILYDDFKKQVETGGVVVQPLLIPYVYDGSPEEISRLNELLPDMRALGFEIEEFGPTSLKIDAVPALLSGIRPENFLPLALAEAGNLTVSALIKEKLALAACKAAIKGGDSLPREVIERVFSYFIKKGMPLRCPHGRPVYVSFSRAYVEKLFGRRP
jgi:DNA mismatch repair protein MutL